MKTNRILLPDLLKGLAGVFMVQVHVTELFIDNAGRESLWGKISLFLGGPFAAMVFMIVMGYFIARNKKTPEENILRGIKIFILGFLLNIGLNFHLFIKIKFDGWQINPFEYMFGVDILYLAGLSIIVLSVLKFANKGREWIALLLFFIFIGLTGFMNKKLFAPETNYVFPFIAGNYTWSYFPLFPWLAYPLLGFFVAHQLERIKTFVQQRKIVPIILVALIAAMVVLWGNMGINTTISLPDYYHHTYRFAFWAIGLVFLWSLLLFVISDIFPESNPVVFLCWIGRNITVFFVIQWLIIGNTATAIYQTQSIGSFIYFFLSIFATTVFLTFLYERIIPKLESTPKSPK